MIRAWDISTLDISSLVTANLKEDNHAEVNPSNNTKLTIDFNDDGTKIFILGSSATTHIYNLTTAYDISSIGAATYTMELIGEIIWFLGKPHHIKMI